MFRFLRRSGEASGDDDERFEMGRLPRQGKMGFVLFTWIEVCGRMVVVDVYISRHTFYILTYFKGLCNLYWAFFLFSFE